MKKLFYLLVGIALMSTNAKAQSFEQTCAIITG
jgi:hypothetical protein